jgi:hypothetical protein
MSVRSQLIAAENTVHRIVTSATFFSAVYGASGLTRLVLTNLDNAASLHKNSASRDWIQILQAKQAVLAVSSNT